MAQRQPPHPPPLRSSVKSWSPDLLRDEEWIRRKSKKQHGHRRRSKSVTDEDIDELKACIELGFGFEHSPKLDDRLSNTLPALGLYHAVNQQYFDTVSKSSSMSSSTSSPSMSTYSYAVSEPDMSSPMSSPHAIFNRGDSSNTMKTRLRQWAQVVACSVRQSSSSSTTS
ncbi:putative cyclin-dependent kinase inhibitor [Tanacetum coccineum]